MDTATPDIYTYCHTLSLHAALPIDSQLLEEAAGYAANLQRMGVMPGDHVAILGPTSRQLVTAIEAVWLAGATIVVLPLPMRLSSIEEFVAQTRDRKSTRLNSSH